LRLRNLALHAEGEFERIEPAVKRSFYSRIGLVSAIHLHESVKLKSLHVWWQAVVADVANTCLIGWNAGVAKRRPLIDGRQECGSPVVDAAVSQRGADSEKPWQVAI